MTLWTIQSMAAWKILQQKQVLFADQRNFRYARCHVMGGNELAFA